MAPARNYNLDAIQAHLLTQYNIPVTKCIPSSAGFDNSVYFIHDNETSKEPRYVLKIIETRQISVVMEGIKTSMKLNRFTTVEYKLSTTGQMITMFGPLKRPAFVMSYLTGSHFRIKGPDDILRVARFVADLHQTKRTHLTGGSRLEAANFLAELSLFWSQKVQDSIPKHFPKRYQFYTRAIPLVLGTLRDELEETMGIWPSLYGTSHGDLNPGNIVDCPRRGLQLIDFDGTSDHGFQLYDLTQLTARTSIATSPAITDRFLKEYLKCTNSHLLEKVPYENLRSSLQCWVMVFALKAMLATDYYTFDVGKHSVEWSQKDAARTLRLLQDCFDNISVSIDHPGLHIARQHEGVPESPRI